MSKFLPGTPCAAFHAGHRTLPPSHPEGPPQGRTTGRPGIRLERRSTPRGDSWRRPGDGVDGVRTPVRSRGASPSLLNSRASWCSYHREALTIASVPGRPCRSQDGDRVPAGVPEGTRVSSRRRFCRRRAGKTESRPACRAWLVRVSEGFGRNWFTGSPRASAGGDADPPEHSRLCRRWPGTRTATKLHTAGQPEASAR
jgi:hypothetical protein